ncbi:LPXTG-site transpeptidase (sortase) family protein [Arthrobacter sp. PL16]|uniref:class F sortase n=1 Tax=Arthrobacter sp. PL16 TaxID=3071720 RepID=UPI002DFE313E|nr:LPXTG-site transpeptidase (sortase) family protein [Arthrobacter sp. PL16]
MSKHSSPDSNQPSPASRKHRYSTLSILAVLVLSLLLTSLWLSLQSSSGIEPASQPAINAGPTIAEQPNESLNPDGFPEPPITTEKSVQSEPPAGESSLSAADPVQVPVPEPGAVEENVASLSSPPATDVVQIPVASAPQRITYTSAGIDVAVYRLGIDQTAQESQTIVPPFTLDGYWLSPFGVPGSGSENTTYIVGHSWEDQDAPFNRLSSSAEPGDTFTVTTGTGVLTYRVDSVTTYLKSTLKNSDIWGVDPNRVVLISCYTEDPWGKNVVVTASPAN